MKNAQMSAAELARLLGVRDSTISNYRSGEREPDFEMKQRMANVLNISIQDLFDFGQPKPETLLRDEPSIDWRARAEAAEAKLAKIHELSQTTISYSKPPKRGS